MAHLGVLLHCVTSSPFLPQRILFAVLIVPPKPPPTDVLEPRRPHSSGHPLLEGGLCCGCSTSLPAGVGYAASPECAVPQALGGAAADAGEPHQGCPTAPLTFFFVLEPHAPQSSGYSDGKCSSMLSSCRCFTSKNVEIKSGGCDFADGC